MSDLFLEQTTAAPTPVAGSDLLPIARPSIGTDLRKTTVADVLSAMAVQTQNGFSGSLSVISGVPTITMQVNFSGLAKAASGALGAAVAGTDFQAPIGTISGIVKGGGANALTAATPGVDFVAPGAATNFSATQAFAGSNSSIAAVLTNAKEPALVSASAPAASQPIYLAQGAITWYTGAATTNWTPNITLSSSASLASVMSANDVVTVTILAAQGTTAYFSNSLQIDGSVVAPLWVGGTAPASGNASSTDIYTYIIRRTSGGWAVIASQSTAK